MSDMEDNMTLNKNEYTLRVKSNQHDTLDLSARPDETVSSLKQSVLSALSSENRYIRLIWKGRMLAPDSALLKEFSLQDGDVVHAVLAAPGVR
jgi:uncharacterized ubiquitin-like protein YukD